jgi:vacuolar iron transporter family protein
MSNFSDAAMSSSTIPAEPISEKQPDVTRSKSKREAAHNEKHIGYGDIIRDIIIGFADGLTVPFALTAGLSSLGSARLVIIGGKYPAYSETLKYSCYGGVLIEKLVI